jgi:hypothetical protein
MGTVRYAIVVKDDAGARGVSHILEHRSEAIGCCAAYTAATGAEAEVVELRPPLVSLRPQEFWGVYSPGILQIFASPEEARAILVENPLATLIPAPIGRAMPIQRGVPQFVIRP